MRWFEGPYTMKHEFLAGLERISINAARDSVETARRAVSTNSRHWLRPRCTVIYSQLLTACHLVPTEFRVWVLSHEVNKFLILREEVLIDFGKFLTYTLVRHGTLDK